MGLIILVQFFVKKAFYMLVRWLQFFKAPYKKEDHTTLIL